MTLTFSIPRTVKVEKVKATEYRLPDGQGVVQVGKARRWALVNVRGGTDGREFWTAKGAIQAWLEEQETKR